MMVNSNWGLKQSLPSVCAYVKFAKPTCITLHPGFVPVCPVNEPLRPAGMSVHNVRGFYRKSGIFSTIPQLTTISTDVLESQKRVFFSLKEKKKIILRSQS